MQLGGEMSERVTIKETSFRPIPAMLETGTQNISAVIALGIAIDFVFSDEYKIAIDNKKQVYKYLLNQLKTIGSVNVIGNTDNNIGVVSFTVENESISDVSALLAEQNIAIRSGHHCAMPLMTAIGIDGTHRVSLGVYNNSDDIDAFIRALKKAIALLN